MLVENDMFTYAILEIFWSVFWFELQYIRDLKAAMIVSL